MKLEGRHLPDPGRRLLLGGRLPAAAKGGGKGVGGEGGGVRNKDKAEVQMLRRDAN
jgi:hypothetical protein